MEVHLIPFYDYESPLINKSRNQIEKKKKYLEKSKMLAKKITLKERVGFWCTVLLSFSHYTTAQ